MPDYTNFKCEIDTDGIAILTWDMPDRSMNVFTEDVILELDTIIDDVVANDAIKGVVVTSSKSQFSGGADLTMLQGLLGSYQKAKAEKGATIAATELFDQSRKLSLTFRKLETCGKPWVAALNGTAAGGACELALSCHGRVMTDNDSAKFGLPEVKVGLFPGAGGTTRILRMMDTQQGLQFLMKGSMLPPKKALVAKIIDKVVPVDELIDTAKQMLLDGLSPVKPWDQKGYRLPSGRVYSPAGFQVWPAVGAIYRRETHDNYPAIRYMIRAAYEGLLMDMDTALRIESRYFAKTVATPEAANMIRSLFLNMQELGKGARRPKGIEKSALKKIAVIGAGFMGAGIAQVSAQAGLDVVLVDRDQESADKGKGHIADSLTKAMKKGRTTQEKMDKLLGHVTPTADYAQLAGCDLVIEAVFEDPDLKASIFKQIEAVVGPDCTIASNTSTLPISGLAKAVATPANFLGIHFFSPVDRMMLVEVIKGKNTGHIAIAAALDFVSMIKKTPILVNDGRGFYANRSVLGYIREGHLMLTEGVPAAMIENLAKQAGMPVGPLSLNDEVALELAWNILQTTQKQLGEAAVDPNQVALLKKLVVDEGRLGRKNGKGFYDYQGRNKKLWPGLKDLAPQQDPDSIDFDEIKDRLLVAQALEAVRVFEEGVLEDVREADVGSILGFGFAPFTGGVFSYIDTMGTPAFLAKCQALEAKFGPRFKPAKLLEDMAANNDRFYVRFDPQASDVAAE
ncbi:3-hydroxyacyl-CoA dehydrogenase NAD-binding domain-containing protein [Cohaesibacter celericrescens]|uniref:3-hydroxyacyl-CoA dehydrogenase n=1 Tax=Cohaesibacter celericrescens TaxID=2067669 RepID=A0A2N5XK30_9HYPH|nr:3-hydroxyacyl-CoA dehydrogenase NAD-binding domain-containing protein [Cohaesibacter celericrescens]PLW74879.1 3-hydroxyacyl-CoA dehydrogenase [Cohaesibacter celericrescens]